MKILLLNQTFHPDQAATSQQTLDLALFLTDRGHQVSAIASRRAYENPTIKLPSHENYRGIEIHRVNCTGFGKRNFFLRVVDGVSFELLLVWKLLFFSRQDVVVSFTSPPLIGFIGTLFCLLRGGRSVQWLMDVNPDAAISVGYLKRGGLAARFLNAIFDFSIKFSDQLVVLDRWMKERIVSHGADPERIVVVPPWPVSELTPELSANAGQAFRAKHGLQDKYVVLYSGNHSIVHPLDTLLQGAQLLRNDPRVVFLFIGGGLRVRDVTSFVEKHQLKNVLQLPHQPRELLQETLASANLHVVVMGEAVSGLVHPSKIYGVLGTGKPYVFIGPRRSHVVDLLQECPYGFHVEHGQARELVSVIERSRGLSAQELSHYARQNIQFVTTHYAGTISMDLFARDVLEKSSEQRRTEHVPAPVRAAK